ncbi:MAG: murein transglycosylase [Bdellovibrionota bacterium]
MMLMTISRLLDFSKTLSGFLILSLLVSGCQNGDPIRDGKSTSIKDIQALSNGNATPTIYYHPVYYTSKPGRNSGPDFLKDINGVVLVKITKEQVAACGLQGSCSVVSGNKMRHYGVHKKVSGVWRFQERKELPCVYGLGPKNTCVDPFFSVAADLNIHPLGEVIFIKELEGKVLPTGEVHDGFLIVRDSGPKGVDRFDFFTGFYNPNDPSNTFVQLGLDDPKNKFHYEKITGDAAQQVRSRRNFPMLTDAVVKRGLAEILALSNQ